MIGNEDEFIVAGKAKIDFSDIDKLKDLLEDLKKEFANLNKATAPPMLRSKRDEIAKQIVDIEKLIQSQEKAIATTQKLARTQDALSSRNVGPTATRSTITGLDNPEKLKRGWNEYSNTQKNLRKEFEATKDSIEEVAEANAALGDYLPTLTKKQRELAGVFKKELSSAARDLIKGAPGSREGASENAIKSMTDRIVDMRAVEPGRFVKGGGWVKTRMAMNEFSLQAGNKLDLVLKELITKGIAQTSATWKPIVARSTSGLYPEDYLRGKSAADEGKTVPYGKSKDAIEKFGDTSGVPTRMPQTRGTLPDRMWYFKQDVLQNFRQAGLLAQEFYLSGDKELEGYLRAITDQMYGTNTQTEEEMKRSEAFFPKRKSKEGIEYKRDYGIKPHPVHALWMLKDLFRQIGQPDERLMPSKRLTEIYKETTGERDLNEPKTPVKADLLAGKPSRLEKSFDVATNIEIFNDLENSIMALKESYSTMNTETAWNKWRDLSRQVSGFQRAEGVRARPLRNMLSDVAGGLIHGIKGYSNLFDPMSVMDPNVMPNKAGWRGQPILKSSGAIESEQMKRGFAPQKFVDVGGIIGKLDVEGFNSIGTGIKKLVTLYRGEAIPHTTEGKKDWGEGVGTWFTDNIEKARGYAGERLINEKTPIIKSITLPESEANKYMLGSPEHKGSHIYTVPSDIAAKAKEDKSLLSGTVDTGSPKYNEIVRPRFEAAIRKVNANVTGIMTAGLVNTTKKVADETAKIISTTELPEQVVPSRIGSPIPPSMQQIPIQITNVSDKFVTKIGGLNREIDNLTKNYPGVKLGPLGPIRAQAKMMGAETPVEVTPEVMTAQAFSILNEQNVMERNMSYGRRGKKGKSKNIIPPEELLLNAGMFTGLEDAAETAKDFVDALANALPMSANLHNEIRNLTKEGRATFNPKLAIQHAFKRKIAAGEAEAPPTIPTEVQPMPPEVAKQMVGETYKLKFTFTDLDQFEQVTDELAKYPGMIKVARNQLELFGGVGQQIAHSVTLEGKFTKPEDVDTVRKGAASISTRSGVVQERSSLEIMDKRLALSERLFKAGQLADKLNWKLVRGQMALLGIAFSMQGAVRMVQSAWTMFGNSISKLQTVFENIAMAMAFGPKSGQSFLKSMLGDSKNIVGAWKTYTGLMAFVNSTLAMIAYKVFSDRRVIDSINRTVDALVNKLDGDFIERIIKLVSMIIDNLPAIIDGVIWIAEELMKVAATPGMGEVLKWMVMAGLAAQFLMTPLALLGGAFQVLSWVLEGLGVTLKAGWILTALGKIVAYFTGEFMVAVTAGAASLALSIGIGFIAGLAVVRVMVEQGVTGWLASVGDLIRGWAPWFMDALSAILWPFGMLGTMIIDIVTLQFDRILPDMAAVFLKAVKAVSGMLAAAFRLLPFNLGASIAVTFEGSQDQLQAEIDRLTAGGGATHRAMGGAVRGGQAFIVGEKGPEVFVPQGAGSIIPNHMIGYANGTVGSPFAGDPFATIPRTFEPITAKLADTANVDKIAAEDNKLAAEDNKQAADTQDKASNKFVTVLYEMAAMTKAEIAAVTAQVARNSRVSLQGSQWDKGTGTWQTPGITKAFTEPYKDSSGVNIGPGRSSTLREMPLYYGSDLDELRLRKQTAEQLGDFKSYSWVASLPKLALGGLIERTGAAVVHKGETVVPESQSSNVNITNYNSVMVNNKVDEKYLENMLGRKYYGSY